MFRNLRERFQLDDQEYIKSITKSQAIKTGPKQYVSYDHRLLLKILTSEEVENMHHLLKEYHPYMVERHGQTLLPQYLGMYRLTVEGTETYVVVMRNIFSSALKVHVKYNLKGSTVDREASEKEKAGKDIPTLKDNDFVREGVKLYLREEDRKRFMDHLQADCNFLAKANIMDYSLCLGIRYSDKSGGELDEEEVACFSNEDGNEESTSEPEPEADRTRRVVIESETDLIDTTRDLYALISAEGAPRKAIYFAGIVDVLTQFGLRKRTAQAAKSVKHGREAEISTVHPDQYAKRFVEFISKSIESPAAP